MGTTLKGIVSEPAVRTPKRYAERVYVLAGLFLGLFVLSILGMALIIWRGRLFVTLSQRSNVETLTLAFFFVLFLYIAAISRSGALGALRIGWFGARGGEYVVREERKMGALKPADEQHPTVALSMVVELEGRPNEQVEIPIEDAAGSMGVLRITGARATHVRRFEHGSNNLLAFAVQQMVQALKERGVSTNLDILGWKTIDDEATEQYLGMVSFACNLRKALGCDELWPSVVLTEDDLSYVREALSAVCPAMRNEAFLPDWEYSAEHKLPIIPEPLGLASLSRNERRADPVIAMGLSLAVVSAALGALALIAFYPPWVPGA